MKTWKTAKTIIKNLVQESWDENWLRELTSTDANILSTLESIKPELWQEGYITLDTSGLTAGDLEKIRSAARAQLELVSEDD